MAAAAGVRGRFRGGLAAALAAAASLGLALSGCGIKLPEISALEWRLETRPAEGGGDYESLSVFVSLKSDESLDNLSELWVVQDDSALAWKLTDADWIKAGEGGITWIGGSALAGPELRLLPRGQYRCIVIDTSGQRTEREFQVSGSFPDRAPPSLSMTGGQMKIMSAWPETLALAFDGTGALIASPAAPGQSGSAALALGADIAARTAELGAYGYDPALRMGSFSKRIKLR
jgi:hypothetical protein